MVLLVDLAVPRRRVADFHEPHMRLMTQKQCRFVPGLVAVQEHAHLFGGVQQARLGVGVLVGRVAHQSVHLG